MTSKQIHDGDESAISWPDIREHRVLAIGARWEGVKSVDWLFGELPNIADYDVVILNCRPLTELITLWEQTPPPKHLWEALYIRQGEVASKLRRVLNSHGQVWALIDPQQRLEIPGISQISARIDNWRWSPWPVSARSERGESKRILESRFEAYFSHLRRWRCVLNLDEEIVSQSDLKEQFGHEASIEHVVTPIAITRESRPIGMTVSYRIWKPEGSDLSRALGLPPEVVFASGSAVYLPLPEGESDVVEALEAFGSSILETTSSTPTPEFVQRLRVPGQDQMEADVVKKRRQISALELESRAVEERLALRRAYTRLVYETGIVGLQDVSRRAFEEIGLATEDADLEVSDEYMLVLNDRKLLVEVKGHRKSASKDDVRQLDESMDQYERKFGNPIKGVLLVNAWCELPLEERDRPQTPSFPDNVVQRVLAIGMSLITGAELYRALCSFWEGTTEAADLFDRLESGSGVVRLTD
jgi:hypothetical protein